MAAWKAHEHSRSQPPVFAVFLAGKLRLLLGLSADVCEVYSLVPISLYET